MSAITIISSMTGLRTKIELLPLKLAKTIPSDDQWDSLVDIAASILKLAKNLEKNIQTLKQTNDERILNESKPHLTIAQTLRSHLVANGQLKHAPVFRRNVIKIFEGPKTSLFDSQDVKSKNAITRERCEQIRNLSPDGIISWAISFAPSFWAGGVLGSAVYSCLLDNIEPELKQTWPQPILDTLHMLQRDQGVLNTSTEYDSFIKALDDSSRGTVTPRKRRRVVVENEAARDVGEQLQLAISQSPSTEMREMKHIYTNGPADVISKMPEPFRSSVQNSRLWRWERAQGLETTGCWPSLFPQDEKQDISFTIWFGHDDGYRLNDIFGSRLAISSQVVSK